MSMVPLRYRVEDLHRETADTVSLRLAPAATSIEPPAPGQFTMLYGFGIGEVPISVSGGDGDALIQTIRAIGLVSTHLHDRRPGDFVGVRGPFGTRWDVSGATGFDLVVMGGGIGLAPLRPVIRYAMTHRHRYRRVSVLIGARSPDDLLFTEEYADWTSSGIDVAVTVDRAVGGWTGHVGVITSIVGGAVVDPVRTLAMVCGPEPMMRFSARALTDAGVATSRIQVSIERNMHCGEAICGHCQLGPLLVCRDGPVVGYDVAEPLITCPEL
jgi:anaerobic sulfite reductase subunit B